MMASVAGVFEIRCEVQRYAWGKLGMNSEVARLSKTANPDFQVEHDQPFAELWMGAHPKAPSMIIRDGQEAQSLLDYIKANPSALGEKIRKRFGDELPFLFKVLSVNKSLSIQAHPNKSHAKKLHSERPDIYKDPNHKPEMAIALTPFEGLCGFRPMHEIQNFIRNIPELCDVIGKDTAEKFLDSKAGEREIPTKLKHCFENVMKCEESLRKENLSKLIARVSKLDHNSLAFSDNLGELLLRLNTQYPGDVGCFVVYFLNHVKLSPGEAMFLGANVPHAYLDGNCIECMACSDNVVRAGLTPKLIDVPTLCEMLDYTPSTAESRKYPSSQAPYDPCMTIYNPPVDDFAVQRISVPDGTKEYFLPPSDSASILLVLEGGGNTSGLSPAEILIRPGVVLFISANSSLKIILNSTKFVAFRALCIL